MPVTPFQDPTYLEAVYAALFELLQGVTFPGGLAFNSMMRTADPPDDVPVASQPALRVFPGPMHATQMDGASSLPGVSKWIFSAGIALYLRADGAANPNPLPTTNANYFVWGISQVLSPTLSFGAYQKQTLGGLVYNCWIEGSVETQVSDEQITIAIPVLILPGPYGV